MSAKQTMTEANEMGFEDVKGTIKLSVIGITVKLDVVLVDDLT